MPTYARAARGHPVGQSVSASTAVFVDVAIIVVVEVAGRVRAESRRSDARESQMLRIEHGRKKTDAVHRARQKWRLNESRRCCPPRVSEKL